MPVLHELSARRGRRVADADPVVLDVRRDRRVRDRRRAAGRALGVPRARVGGGSRSARPRCRDGRARGRLRRPGARAAGGDRRREPACRRPARRRRAGGRAGAWRPCRPRRRPARHGAGERRRSRSSSRSSAATLVVAMPASARSWLAARRATATPSTGMTCRLPRLACGAERVSLARPRLPDYDRDPLAAEAQALDHRLLLGRQRRLRRHGPRHRGGRAPGRPRRRDPPWRCRSSVARPPAARASSTSASSRATGSTRPSRRRIDTRDPRDSPSGISAITRPEARKRSASASNSSALVGCVAGSRSHSACTTSPRLKVVLLRVKPVGEASASNSRSRSCSQAASRVGRHDDACERARPR